MSGFCPPSPGACSNSGPLIQWGDTIQPSRTLSLPSPQALNLCTIGALNWILLLPWLVSKHLRIHLLPMDVRYCYRNGSPAAHSSKANKEASLEERVVCFILETSSLLEKAMAPHSSTLAWKTPWTEEPGRLQSMGSLRVRHNWSTSLSLFTFMHWRRKWQPTPVFLPGESQGWGSMMGCHLWGCTELVTTEVT